MFWLAAAPTRARACAQRAATQGLDEVTATPSMPVRSQRPTREKVIAAPRDHGGRVDLDDPLGSRERLDHDPRRGRMHSLQPAAHDAVDGLAVAQCP
jgi:hypothetical protein